MKTELVQSLTSTFEAHAQQTETGVEFWLARDIQYLLGYIKWDNFLNVVSKAKTACDGSGHAVPDHFADVGKTIAMPKGAEKEVPDLMLTRYACYLIAQNGDPKKQEIAFAQTYFAVQTRKAELIEQRLLDAERVSARKKLSATEHELSEVIFEQVGGSNQDFAAIHSKGDHALNDRIRPADRRHSRAGGNPVTGKQCAVVIARRIGVRAQFGETLFSDSSAAGRIGIRPQFSYRSAKTVGGLVDRHSQVFPGILKNNSLLRMLNRGYGAISALNRVENRLATVGPC